MFRHLPPSILLLAASLSTPAWGAVLEFTDKAAWQAQAGPYTTIGFSDLPHNTIVTNQYESLGALFTDGIDLVTFAPSVFINDDYGLRGIVDSITVEFLQPMHVVAVDHPGSVQFELYSQGSLIYTSSPFINGGVGFFAGLVSDQTFDEVRIFDPKGNVNIDDLHFGPPIPAPPGLALLGAMALIVSKRRRRTSS